jgi:UDP-N-acetylmuramoyl-tripeptide--D-alanyl-D-alanine ligase
MKPLTIRQIRQAVGGVAVQALPSGGPPVRAVCTDTRHMEEGSLFVPIRGENFDGHAFLAQAAAGGAIAALVDAVPKAPPADLPLIKVRDTLRALGHLARHVRLSFRGKVVAVAGSNGKTSTKRLIDAALSSRLRGSMSPKSFNNNIGVPLAIFPADPQDDYLVLEIGTNHHGEIRPLADMSLPDIAVITNCVAEHLEGLDDLEGVRRENTSIIGGLNSRGTLIVNGDDPELIKAVSNWTGRRITFGVNPGNDLFAADIHCQETGTTFNLGRSAQRVFVPMLGRHAAVNALAAIAVARTMGLPDEAMIDGIAKTQNAEMRLQLTHVGDVTILNDAYNANPSSMKAALETLISLPAAGRRVAVLGEMRELGQASEKYHREVGGFVGKLGKIQTLVCIGGGGQWIAQAAGEAGFASTAIHRFPDAKAAAAVVPGLLRRGDLVLLKASRSVQLEAVADAIAQRTAPRRLAAS